MEACHHKLLRQTNSSHVSLRQASKWYQFLSSKKANQFDRFDRFAALIRCLRIVHGFKHVMIRSWWSSVFCCLISISVQNGSPVEHWSTSFVYRNEKRGLKLQLSFSHKGKAEPILSAVLISFVSNVSRFPTWASLKIWTEIVCSQRSQMFELLWLA